MAEWAFYDSILGAKEQVIGQFDSDSNEVQGAGPQEEIRAQAAQA
jgi:hypothetical protein